MVLSLIGMALLAMPAPPSSSPDGGAPLPPIELPAGDSLLLAPSVPQLVRVPGLERFASTEPDEVTVEVSGPDLLQVVAQPASGAQLDLWMAGKHRRLAVFAQWACPFNHLKVDHLPFTHSHLRVQAIERVLMFDGEVGSMEDVAALEALLAPAEDGMAVVRISPDVVASAIAAVNARMPPGVHAAWAGDRVVLRAADDRVPASARTLAHQALGPLERLARDHRVRVESPADESQAGVKRVAVCAGCLRFVPGNARSTVGVSDPQVVEARVQGAGVLLTGLKAGAARVRVVSASGEAETYEVSVQNNFPDVGFCELCKVIGQSFAELRDGPFQLKFIGDRIFVDGAFQTFEQLLRIEALHRRYPRLQVLARPSPELIARLKRSADRELQRLGLPQAHFEQSGESFAIEGEVRGADEQDVVKGIFGAYLEPVDGFSERMRPQPSAARTVRRSPDRPARG